MKTRISRRTKAMLAASALALSVVVSGAAWALTYSYDISYYSDATHTELVGERGFQCNGVGWGWGYTTQYFVKNIDGPCNGGGH